jgi:hypothetical protein
MVRRRAADGLIAMRHTPNMIDAVSRIATNLREDPNIGVRSRIEFLFRKGVLQPPRESEPVWKTGGLDQ